MANENDQQDVKGNEPDPTVPSGVAPQGPPPGSAVSASGPMSTGPDAGAGPGGAEDTTPRPGADERGSDGPLGSQDSGSGDLDEAGD